MRAPALHGILVTYRRPAALSVMLGRLSALEGPLELLVVVDNSPSAESREAVRRHPAAARRVAHLESPENLGPSGGIAAGMERVLEVATDEDWLVLLDDDDPPASGDLLPALAGFAVEMLAQDPRCGGVGLVGSRFDWRRARLVRVPDAELTGPVSVDYVGGNQLPFYRAGAVRDVGTFLSSLFFGYEELEFGLRLRRAGYQLYAHGPLWRRERERRSRLGLSVRPSLVLGEADWRRYYGLRNLIYLLRSSGRTAGAVRVTLVKGLAKPVLNLPARPGVALRHLRLNWLACRDGWLGRLGRTLAPGENPPKATEA